MVTSLPTTLFSFDGSGLPIETVTVYRPSGAQVIRKLDVDLKVSIAKLGGVRSAFPTVSLNHICAGQAGNNVIEVTNLSTITDTESFRVDGLGNAKLLIVQCVLDRHPEIPKSDPIRDLKSQLHELRMEKAAREQEVAILKGFGGSMAEKPDLTPDQAKTFSDTLFDKIIACAEAVRDLDEKITRLNQKINKTRSSKVGATAAKAIITILADEDGPAHLRLTYREGGITELKSSYSLSTGRCAQRSLGPPLRPVHNFRRRKTVDVRLPSLPRQPLTIHGRRLDQREADPQHIRDGPSQRRDTKTR